MGSPERQRNCLEWRSGAAPLSAPDRQLPIKGQLSDLAGYLEEFDFCVGVAAAINPIIPAAKVNAPDGVYQPDVSRLVAQRGNGVTFVRPFTTPSYEGGNEYERGGQRNSSPKREGNEISA
ncbi:hypothetical protein JQ633_33175 [Bradyrhizobium tropiciagri]|uniref:hypothetical protein n=1 Tax=Bradyrhizobium tropiciagri TaxID=312253 RepID=UPI001BAB9F20|nr:hypothetical protein [Bradyrhizobium tropiciagri]MBR0875253.1 hypothetical protein [Bradyrhizobium tropiciagri]